MSHQKTDFAPQDHSETLVFLHLETNRKLDTSAPFVLGYFQRQP